MLGLKAECGYKLAQKLEDMFNNMELPAETVEGYRTHLRGNIVRNAPLWNSTSSTPQAHPVSTSVTVMTSTY